jgi:nucleotide-binding universal stress UspA family protein
MKQILVGIDGSTGSFVAAAQAALLAATTGAELHAVTVIHPSDYKHDELDGYLRPPDRDVDLPEFFEREAAARLAKCSEIANAAGVALLHQKSYAGLDIANELLEYAHRNAIDLIVVGSRGRGRLAGLLLGSVSQKLASGARCSVLIVR